MAVAYDTAAKGHVAGRAEEERALWTAKRALIDIGPGCNDGTPEGPRCELTTSTPGVRKPEKYLATATVYEAALDLRAYASALEAVSNAADRAALQKAQGETLAALEGLGTRLGTAGAAQLQAGGALFNLAVTAELDRRRLAALRTAVRGAHPMVQRRGDELGQGLSTLRRAQIAQLYRRSSDLAATLTPELAADTYEAQVRRLQSLVDENERLRKTEPLKAATALVDAHGALLAALNDPGRQGLAVAAAVKTFADAARELHTALAPEVAAAG